MTGSVKSWVTTSTHDIQDSPLGCCPLLSPACQFLLSLISPLHTPPPSKSQPVTRSSKLDLPHVPFPRTCLEYSSYFPFLNLLVLLALKTPPTWRFLHTCTTNQWPLPNSDFRKHLCWELKFATLVLLCNLPKKSESDFRAKTACMISITLTQIKNITHSRCA